MWILGKVGLGVVQVRVVVVETVEAWFAIDIVEGILRIVAL